MEGASAASCCFWRLKGAFFFFLLADILPSILASYTTTPKNTRLAGPHMLSLTLATPILFFCHATRYVQAAGDKDVCIFGGIFGKEPQPSKAPKK